MTKIFLAAVMAVLFALGGCASGLSAGGSPAQILFQAKSDYAGALTAAVAYKRLPPCSAAGRVICSDPTMVAQLQKADTVAATALDAAESVMRAPGFGVNVLDSAVAAATAALQAFLTVVSALGVK